MDIGCNKSEKNHTRQRSRSLSSGKTRTNAKMGLKLTLCVLLAVVTFVHSLEIYKGKLKFKVSGRNLPSKDNGLGRYLDVFSSEDGGRTRTKVGTVKDSMIENKGNPDWDDVFEFDFDRFRDQIWYLLLCDSDERVGGVWVSVTDYVDKGQLTSANLDTEGYIIINSVDTIMKPRLPYEPLGSIPLNSGTPRALTLRFKVSASRRLPTKNDVGFIPGNSGQYVMITSRSGLMGEETFVGRSSNVTSSSNLKWPDIFAFQWDNKKDQRWHLRIYDDDKLLGGGGWVEVNDYVAKSQTYTLNIPTGGTITISKACC